MIFNKLVLLFSLFCWAVVNAADPCENAIDIGHPRRSVASVLQQHQTPLCDHHIVTNPDTWYRFIQYTGQKMPETCVDLGHCGTVSPIWMNGSHPEGEDIVEAIACRSQGMTQDCCDWSGPMFVKRCAGTDGVYFIYRLPTPQGCPEAFCAGDMEPCPQGTEWDPEDEECVALPTTPQDEETTTGGSITLHAARSEGFILGPVFLLLYII